MADPWTHHTRTVNGFHMHYVSAGSGYPLVFLHGWPQSWYEWRKIIAPLVERFMALDTLPGLGRRGETIDFQAAKSLWHVFFHAGMPDLAEQLVSANVEAYLRHFYTSPIYNYSPNVFSDEDVAEYVRVYSAPGALRAGSQYYRAGINEDLDNLIGPLSVT